MNDHFPYSPLGSHGALGIAVIFFAAPVLALDGSIAGQSWEYFLDRCGLAYTDPERYLDDLSGNRGPSSVAIAVTQDGSILWGGTTGLTLHDSYSSAIVGNRRVQSCYAMGWFDGSSATAEEINADFLQITASMPDLVMTGGLGPETSVGMDGAVWNEPVSYHYAVLGALPNQIMATIVIGLGVVEMFSYHTDDVE